MTGECNYGGRVTDDKDRILTNDLLKVYYSTDCAYDENYKFSEYDEYHALGDKTWQEHLDWVQELPNVTPPEVFGFNKNASLSKEQGETYSMVDAMLSTVGSSSGGGGAGPETTVGAIASDVLANLPKAFDVAQVQNKYPIMYEESMNTVIGQELARYNKLIGVVRSSLMDIQKAIKGLLLMDQSLEACFNSIFDGKVPEMWAKKSYVTRKPLGSYVNDLLDRLKWFQVWIDTGVPIIFWFSGIFFTQAFTTGALQNFARKYTTPIDTLAFDFDYPREQEPKEKPADGVWTRGLFFEATRWDDDKWQLEDSFPKVLFAPVPLFHLLPQPGTELRKFPCYNCPCYKVASRKGTLSTTGHSTNFVMFIRINSDRPSEFWVKRGACMLTQLDV